MAHQFKELFAMFQQAATKLKYPKINFKTTDGGAVQLYLATKGYIAIKVNSKYVGKLQDTDTFRMYEGTTEQQNQIMAFCSKPLTSAKIYGQKYNHCCFCGLELTAKESVQMGYGPICAEKFGLPWEYIEPVQEKLADLFDAPIVPIAPVVPIAPIAPDPVVPITIFPKIIYDKSTSSAYAVFTNEEEAMQYEWMFKHKGLICYGGHCNALELCFPEQSEQK